MKKVLFILSVILFFNFSYAQTKTWVGGIFGIGDWSTPSNWNPAGVPNSNHDVVFSGGGVIYIDTNVNVKSFTSNGGGILSRIAFDSGSPINFKVQNDLILRGNSWMGQALFGDADIITMEVGNLIINGNNVNFGLDGNISSTLNVNGNMSITDGDVMSQNGNVNITVAGNYTQNGTSLLTLSNNNNATLNVNGSMAIGGNASLNVQNTNTGSGTVNLKGNLTVNSGSNDALFANTSSNFYGRFNFNNSGNQNVNVSNVNTLRNLEFAVRNGSVSRLLNDLTLGSRSRFIVNSGGELNFNYSSTDTPFHVRGTGANNQFFLVEPGGKIRITSPEGIGSAGNDYGNVRTSVRNFSPGAIYHYVGRTNQFTGNGIPNTPADGKRIIVDLSTNDLIFRSNRGSKIQFGNTGTLEIRRGIVEDDDISIFGNASSGAGNLTMTGGRFVQKRTGIMPELSGTYNLTGGIVDYTNSNSAIQNVRNNKEFFNIDISGTNVHNQTGNSILVKGTFTVKPNAIFTMNSNQIAGVGTGSRALRVENNGTFRTNDLDGFSGNNSTSVGTSIAQIHLLPGSWVEYAASGNQTITNAPVNTPAGANYENLRITGSGTKTTVAGETRVNDLTRLAQTQSKLTVPQGEGNVFYAYGGIDNAVGGEFTLSNDAQLMQNPTAVNTGKVKVERYVTGMRYVNGGDLSFVYWSSPVENQRFIDFSSGSQYFMWYNEENDYFYPLNITNTPNFTTGQGYAISAESNQGSTYSKTYIFDGKPHNNSYTININRTPSNPYDHGYNLVGNPYPSNIDADLLFAQNPGIYTSIWFWTNDEFEEQQYGSEYEGSNYAIYNGMGGVNNAPDAGNAIVVPDGTIKVSQGFIIQKRDVGAGTLTFNNGVRNTSGGVFYQKAGEKDRFWLTMKSPTNMISMTLLGYHPMATDGYEKDFDEEFSIGSEGIYSLLGDQKLWIQGKAAPFDNNDVIPIGFKFYEEGYHQIDIYRKEGVFANQAIFLHDKETGKIYDFGIYGERVSIYGTPGEVNDRYEIIFKKSFTDSPLSLNDLFAVSILKKDKNIEITSNKEKITSVEIVNLSGRSLYKNKKVNNNLFQIPVSLFKKGIVVVNVITGSGHIENKKLILN